MDWSLFPYISNNEMITILPLTKILPCTVLHDFSFFELTRVLIKIKESFLTLFAIVLSNDYLLIMSVMTIVILFIKGPSESINLCI
jgi:hypothetical protein